MHMLKRDKTIDRLRAIAMFWVIVVHVLYWGSFFRNSYINVLKSFCLFEMPLFFFVMGASNSYSKIDKYSSFVYKRFKRVLIPYWFYAVICAFLSVAYLGVRDKIDLFMIAKILLSWIIPVDRQITTISYVTSALWFVPVCLCVNMIIPFLKRMEGSKNRITFLFVGIFLFVIVCLFKMGWIQNIVFYSLWTYIGLFYNEILERLNQNKFRKRIGILVVSGIVLMFLIYTAGGPIDMQHNKFPPNIVFGVFSVVMMSLILLIIPYINKLFERLENNNLIKKIIDLYSLRSMTIFLYQSFAFALTVRFCKILIDNKGFLAGFIKSVTCLLLTVPICALAAHFLGRIEDYGKTNKCN